MGKRHFIAVFTDSDFLCGCNHKHANVTTATACISEPGGYVVAVRRRKYLPLTDAEETEFQKAMYGRAKHQENQALDVSLVVTSKLKA